MKPPIWERQGRPKPPSVGWSGFYPAYARSFRRFSVVRVMGSETWAAARPHEHHGTDFPTFADAIAYADREARR